MNTLDIGVLSGTALFSAVLGSVAGTGGTAVLLPVLVHYFGIQAAVPMVAEGTALAPSSWCGSDGISRSRQGPPRGGDR